MVPFSLYQYTIDEVHSFKGDSAPQIYYIKNLKMSSDPDISTRSKVLSLIQRITLQWSFQFNSASISWAPIVC